MADTLRVNVYADNWFVLYINGKLTAVDPIPFTPHNVVSVDILPEYPMTIAVMARDNADRKWNRLHLKCCCYLSFCVNIYMR